MGEAGSRPAHRCPSFCWHSLESRLTMLSQESPYHSKSLATGSEVLSKSEPHGRIGDLSETDHYLFFRYLAVATAGSMVGNVLEIKNLCHPNALSAAASACRWPSSLRPRYRRSMTGVSSPRSASRHSRSFRLHKATRANVRRRSSQTLTADWTRQPVAVLPFLYTTPGPEQVAPAGTFRADLLKSRGSPDVFFAAGSVSDRRALYGRVDSLRVRRHPPAIGGKRQWGFHYPLGIARYTPLRPAGFTI